MKRLLSILILFVLVASSSAVIAAENKPKEKGKLSIIERLQGKIESVTPADEAKSKQGSFSIIDSDGKKNEFILLPKTHFYSAGSTPIKLTDLKKGDGVLVLYVVTLKGLKEAITVSQSKS